MKCSLKVMLFICLLTFAVGEPALSEPVDLSHLTSQQQSLLNEHVYGGLPGISNIYIRNAYVLSYNCYTRTPDWVAYHIKPDYRNTPQRKGKFKIFRDDPDNQIEPADADYAGLLHGQGYARGHLAPYGIMGGDRDGDGQVAVYGNGNTSDPDDEQTIFQGNYMSNIAPQHHSGFNGAPGLWWKLERWIQDVLVTGQGKEVWIFDGCIFGPGEHEKVGPSKDIWVPPMFYKLVIIPKDQSQQPNVLAFLFPHQRVAHGKIEDFLVSIDVIEALTGENFFSELGEDAQASLENKDTWTVWKELEFKSD